MSGFFPSKPPRRDLTPEDKSRLARRFRRRAGLTDALLTLGILFYLVSRCMRSSWSFDMLMLILLLAGVLCSIAAYTRCPCCGRMPRRGERMGPFIWRGFECPVCGFMPEWSK